ncbi:MAG: sigma-70 family RNA polymerase sigma factor [Gemmatimonadetes bacterium]|nr:sigma-70 family RNA polymerase sigma factor [Gemmatimonadota bacterium]
MSDSVTDAEAIGRVRAGDTEAFGILMDRYGGQCTAYAKYMTGSLDEAADIVQEALVRAYRSLNRCNDPDRFKGWLFRILRNQCRTHLARRRRRQHQPLSDELPAPGTTDAATDAEEVRRKVHEALQRLSVEHREALVLKYVHDMSLPDMAELLGASISALKMRLQRGRLALREKLGGVMP